MGGDPDTAPGNVLAEICAAKREHVDRRMRLLSFRAISAAAERATPPRGFIRALRRARDVGRYGLIAEIKRASPSKGVIREDFDHLSIAEAYERGGASCLSILTDRPYFQGHDEYLTQARDEVRLPVLRKDFIIDPYQIMESRALGADCILLILAALDQPTAERFERTAHDLGMDVLVEVHDESELDRALALTSPLIGINNRDLKTLRVDLTVGERMAARVPSDRLLVCESGLSSRADLDRMWRSGVSTFLIGESLMRQPDIESAVRELVADPMPTAARR